MNVRIIAVLSGGILFGAPVGIITGIVSGVHRYLIDMDGVTAIPCLITSILAGLVSGYIHKYTPKPKRWIIGIGAGMICEALTMLLILLFSYPDPLGADIVSQIALPMILVKSTLG